MIVDQGEIKALLSQAEELSEAAAPPTPVAPASTPTRRHTNLPPEIARLLGIKVPVIVHLAERRMHISESRKFTLGMIIEFDKPVDEPLDLMINNRPIGCGEAVKVGESFGLRVSEIRDAASRIKSMGS